MNKRQERVSVFVISRSLLLPQFFVKMNDNLNTRITEVLLERPIGFKIEGLHYQLRPLTMGAGLLSASLIRAIGFDGQSAQANLHLEMMRLYTRFPLECLRLIAYRLLKGREVLDNEKVEEIIHRLKEDADTADIVGLLELTLMRADISDIEHHYHIDSDNKEYNRIMREKGQSNTFLYCGKTIWGRTIATLAEKFGWTIDYILWEVSMDNINLLLADMPKSVYLTDEEVKKIHPRGTNRTGTIKADDPRNKELILSMNWD